MFCCVVLHHHYMSHMGLDISHMGLDISHMGLDIRLPLSFQHATLKNWEEPGGQGCVCVCVV